jgi:hypothetical protein
MPAPRLTPSVLCLAALLVAPIAAGQAGRTVSPRAGARAGGEPPPWPTPGALAERRAEAEARRLFADDAPLVLTLTADFKAVTRDRDPDSTRTFPATITYTGAGGTTVSTPLAIRNRGHARRQVSTCDFPPLRLEFDRAAVTDTVFAGHRALKLGTHCREVSEFEQYVLREFAAYRIFNLITPQSFRVRLARATYVDTGGKKTLPTRYGLFIEDDDDVARRLEGRVTSQLNLMYRHFNAESATWLGLFEYLIGNTDVSIVTQHNVRTVETPASGRYVIPYDFDYSGLVGASYAVPNRQLGLVSVKDRLYRGPCRTPEEFAPFFARLRTLEPDILAIYDALPDLTAGYRKSAKNYLDEFYRTIERPDAVRKQLVNGCIKSGI